MSVISRIEAFRKAIDISQKDLCNKVGYPASSYTSAKNRNSDVGSSLLVRICEEFPSVNIDWLITGNGDMIKGESTNPVEDSAAYRELERKYIRCLEEKDTLKKTTDTGIVAVTRKKKLK